MLKPKQTQINSTTLQNILKQLRRLKNKNIIIECNFSKDLSFIKKCKITYDKKKQIVRIENDIIGLELRVYEIEDIYVEPNMYDDNELDILINFVGSEDFLRLTQFQNDTFSEEDYL